MPIVVRSVKTGMMRRGNPRSGLGGGPSWGVGGQRLAPQLGRLHEVHVYFGVLGVRNLTPRYFPSFR
ncbi:hypothetical protein [Hafnia paralvei]|uniref:hypothetical protein n=1 Tax=Hafnia paralvei TaxID=546367 RepID=UPI001D0F0F8A|nr:hypothetical protein [Hafnia paralvei]